MNGIKSFTESNTVKWAIRGVILPTVLILLNSYSEQRNLTNEEIGTLVSLAITSVMTISSRVQAKDRVYTPSYLPGPNREELITDQGE